ncbi:MAG: MBL fold metallo-hydrolase [Hyphomicrobiales bacterium]
MILAFVMAPPSDAKPSRCLAIAENNPGITYVSLRQAALAEDEVKLTFVGHSTYLIETPQGVTIATDYAGYAGPGVVPKVVTMNHAHETHYTDFPDSRIEHVLRGWDPKGGAANHDVEVDDVHIRNVPTDIRTWAGTPEVFGNSIFIFEVAGLCIGHLGHLHHIPTPQHYGIIGILDVVMVPVDGTFTLKHDSMAEVLKTLRARLILPMHFFGTGTLASFLDALGGVFEIKTHDGPTITISDKTLPKKPTVMVLPGF